MFKVTMQFIPGNDQIWVSKLDPNDPEYVYPTEQEAIDKAMQLQAADSSGRIYKSSQI
jgi:hypothetical protein